MQTATTSESANPAAVGHDDAGHGDHPTEKTYIAVAAVLAVLTAIEVGLYYVSGISDTLLSVVLVVLALAKFIIVLGYFMHLKYDKPLFRQLFLVGMVMAMICYAVVLFAMRDR
jgi:cytochrome c oxidase subunit 4